MVNSNFSKMKSTLDRTRAQSGGVRARRRRFATLTAVAALIAGSRAGLAAPTGGTVVEGSAAISQNGSATNIHQSTNRAVIDWMGFSVGAGESVNFFQPTSLSVTLNRVIGNESSVIAGALNANGRVFIVNSNGVLFTKDAQVNVGGLVASTRDISNADFMAGNYRFSGSSSAAVVNRGNLRASDGGYIALLGRSVTNEGVITATLGSIALASGDKITLNFGGDSLVDVTIDKGAYQALVQNKGLIRADGGRVVMSAKAADAVLAAQVNNSGIVQARTLSDLTGGAASQGTVRIGKIKLIASGGTTKVSGRLDASAPKGGKGGVIETSGDKVKVAGDAIITTRSASGQNGDWIIDPDGFTVAATGGDITGAALSQQLESNNVTIYSTSGGGSGGNIDIYDPIDWAANTTLAFDATNSINVNAVITGAGAASSLALNAGEDININAPSSLQVAALAATATGDVNINAAQSWTTAGAWSFSGADISINDTIGWSAGALTMNAGSFIYLNAVMTASDQASLVLAYNATIDKSVDAGGLPTATYGIPLGGLEPLFDATTGKFVGRIDFIDNVAPAPLAINGNAYTLITTIGQPTLADGSPNPHDLDVINANGGVGYYALAANLTAPATAFGLAPIAQLGGVGPDRAPLPGVLEGLGHSIVNLSIDGGADPGNQLLGLVGYLYAAEYGTSSVRDISLENVNVTAGSSYIGALVGQNWGGLVANAYAQGSISVTSVTDDPTAGWPGSDYIGGMIGSNQGAVYNAHADVDVTTIDANYVGGFVGENAAIIGTNFFGAPLPWGIIRNSSASGDVNVTITNVNAAQANATDAGFGGFAGANAGVITESSSSGDVTATAVGYPGYFISVNNVGGFVGSNLNNTDSGFVALINGSFSSSSVTATVGGDPANAGFSDAIGGFVGNNGAGSVVSNSRSVGPVIGEQDVGGFAGVNQGQFSDNTFNSATTGQQIGTGYDPSGRGGATATSDTGPSSTQGPQPSRAAQTAATARNDAARLTQQASAQQAQAAADAVSRAAAAQAAQAATQQAALQAANVTMNNARSSAATAPTPLVSSSAGKSAVAAATPASLEEKLTIEEPPPATAPPPAAQRKPHPQRHAGTTQKVRAGHGGSGFGARIRSIDSGGQHYELNGGSAAPTNH